MFDLKKEIMRAGFDNEIDFANHALDILINTPMDTLKSSHPEKLQKLRGIFDDSLKSLQFLKNKAGDGIAMWSEESTHQVAYSGLVVGYDAVIFHLDSREDACKLFEAFLLVKEVEAD